MKKKSKKLETLIKTTRIYSQSVRMEFGIKKCTQLIIKYMEKKTQRTE